MKKNLSKILIFPIFLIIFGNLSMEKTFAQSCAIAGGPITEMTDYAKNLQSELSEILKDAQSKNLTCEGKSPQDVSKVFGAALKFGRMSRLKRIFCTAHRWDLKVILNGAFVVMKNFSSI